MAFKNYSSKKETSTESNVDWNALNKYVVETAGLQKPEVLVGVLVGLVDLGEQEQEDAEVVFTGTAEDEQAEIAKSPNTYFENGIDPVTRKKVRMKRWPQKPVDCVAVAVDFPQIMLDKSQFFDGEAQEPKPLRMWLGNQFYLKESGQVIARPTPMKWSNLEKDRSKPPRFSLAQNHLFYKMAVDSKLIDPADVFTPDRIDELLGKAFQFQAQIFMRKDDSSDKEYLTEKVKYVGGLGRGQTAPEGATEPFVVMFDTVNSEESIKQLRSHVINTIKRSSKYEGSVIQKQLEKDRTAKPVQSDTHAEVPETPAEKPAKAAKTKPKSDPTPKPEPVPAVPEDDDAPF